MGPLGLKALRKAALGGVLMAMVLGTLGGALWWTVLRPRRAADAAIDRMARDTGLVRTTTAESGWHRLRATAAAPFSSLPMARGDRAGQTVEVGAVPAGGRGHRATTWVLVIIPGAGVKTQLVGISKEYGQLAAATTNFVGVLPLRLTGPNSDSRFVQLDWFGDAAWWGTRVDFESAFTDPVASLLRGFPRPIATVLFEGRVFLLQWFGLETDPAIVEAAFRLGVACLRESAP